MRVEREMAFAQIQGTLMRFLPEQSGEAMTTLKALSDDRGGMTSAQLDLVHRLIQQVVVARDRVTRQALVAGVPGIRLPGEAP